MEGLGLVLAFVFLPLFPLSMLFNAALERAGHLLPRVVLMLVWPQVGLVVVPELVSTVPHWVVVWALATSTLYGFRLLTMREMGRWIGFLATSAWALIWLALHAGIPPSDLRIFAIAFSLPLAVLVLLARVLEHQFGAAYTGLYGGLAQRMPRFAGVLVVSVLAATATPLFPAFFGMLQTLVVSRPVPAVILGGIWLIWSWAAARLLQGLIVGPAEPGPELDLSIAATWAYAAGLVVLTVAGLILSGGRL